MSLQGPQGAPQGATPARWGRLDGSLVRLRSGAFAGGRGLRSGLLPAGEAYGGQEEKRESDQPVQSPLGFLLSEDRGRSIFK